MYDGFKSNLHYQNKVKTLLIACTYLIKVNNFIKKCLIPFY